MFPSTKVCCPTKFLVATQIFFDCQPDPWGKDPIWLTHIFQMVWFNHLNQPNVFVDAPVRPSGSLGWPFQGGSPSLPGGCRLRRIEAGVRFFQWKKKVGRFACNLLNGRKYRGNCITLLIGGIILICNWYLVSRVSKVLLLGINSSHL